MNVRTKPVVVTGMGVITAAGATLTEFEAAIFNGHSGIGPVTLFDVTEFPCQLAGQVKQEDLTAGFAPRSIKRASRCDLLGLIAAQEAVADAGLQCNEPQLDVGVILGGGAGGMRSWELFRRAQFEKKRAMPSPLLGATPCILADRIAQRYQFNGFRSTITTACSSSSTSIGLGYDLVRSGELSAAIVGGSESLSELTFGGFNALRVMDEQPCRPFDKDRQGLSLGEGAAVIVLETYDRAMQRSARIYAEVCGYATNSDAYHMTAPHPEARGMRNVMLRAATNAGITMEQIDYINAHGTGTPVNDPLETKAIKMAFKADGCNHLPPVSSTKSMVGHCLGAAGGIEAVAVILAIHRQQVPPTASLQTPDPACDLNYVPGKAQDMPISYALSNSFAFGGNNTSVVFGRACEF